MGQFGMHMKSSSAGLRRLDERLVQGKYMYSIAICDLDGKSSPQRGTGASKWQDYGLTRGRSKRGVRGYTEAKENPMRLPVSKHNADADPSVCSACYMTKMPTVPYLTPSSFPSLSQIWKRTHNHQAPVMGIMHCCQSIDRNLMMRNRDSAYSIMMGF